MGNFFGGGGILLGGGLAATAQLGHILLDKVTPRHRLSMLRH
jgi:hypothetical protein